MRKFLVVAGCAAVVALIGAMSTINAEDKAQGDPYPLATCPVSGEELGGMGEPVVFVHEGREVRLCCAGCQKKFDADPAAMIEKIDAQIKEQQAGKIPLTTCIVSGKALGDSPVVEVIGNRAVAFCCDGCPKKFKEDVPASMAKLDAAIIDAAKPVNEGGNCPISGKPVGEKPVNLVYGTEVVSFCCDGCPKKFEEDFTASMKKLHEGQKQS